MSRSRRAANVLMASGAAAMVLGLVLALGDGRALLLAWAGIGVAVVGLLLTRRGPGA